MIFLMFKVQTFVCYRNELHRTKWGEVKVSESANDRIGSTANNQSKALNPTTP